MRLEYAILFVKDIDRLADFYTALGLQPRPETRTPTWVEFTAGLALHAVPAGIASGIEVTDPPAPREETPIKLIFAVDELQAQCEKLEAAGISLTRRPWGACDVVDPEGNIFQLCAPPEGVR